MTDNSDNVLNVLIKLGVIGQADAQAAKQLLAETAGASEQLKGKLGDSTAALGEYQGQSEALGEAEGKTAEQTRDSATAQLALHQALDKLSEVLPGLGGRLNQLTQGHQDSAEATKTGAAANETFRASVGPIAAVILTLQTAAEYWDKYKEHVQSAQETHSAALKQMEISLRSALQAQSEFNGAIQGGEGKKSAGHNSQKADQPRNLSGESETAFPGEHGDDTRATTLLGHLTAGAGKINQSQADALNQLRNAFSVLNGNTDNLLAAIKHGYDHQLSVQQEVQLIKRQLQALAARSTQTAYSNQ
jgi:hypothetical protein